MGKAKEQGLNREYVQTVTNAPKFGIRINLGTCSETSDLIVSK